MKNNLILSNSFVTFLKEQESCKISTLLRKLYFFQKYSHAIGFKYLNTNEVNYLTFRKDGTISFLPNGKEHKETDNGEWSRDGRQNGKPSKVIRKVFNNALLSKLTDKDFENFANNYKAKGQSENLTFQILPASKIAEIYDDETARDCGGNLGNSCMNNKGEYMDIYTNCDKLQIITLRDGNSNLVGRALLWDIGNSQKLMDRVYTSKEEYVNLFKDFAVENKFLYKQSLTSSGNKKSFFSPENNYSEVVNKTIRINTKTDFDSYPYIDTFSYGGYGYLINDNSNGSIHEYQSTDGDRIEGVWCAHSNEYYPEEDMRYIEGGRYDGEYIYYDYAVYVNSESCYYYENDDNLITIDGEYYTKDNEDVCYCEDTDEYCHIDNAVCCTIGEYSDCWISKDNAREVCGHYFHVNDINEC